LGASYEAYGISRSSGDPATEVLNFNPHRKAGSVEGSTLPEASAPAEVSDSH